MKNDKPSGLSWQRSVFNEFPYSQIKFLITFWDSDSDCSACKTNKQKNMDTGVWVFV